MRKRALIRLLSIFTLLLLAAQVLALTALRRKVESENYQVTAYFTEAIGLFPESEVRVLGVAIGRVLSVDPQGPKVKVVMQLEDTRKIPAQANASIIPISLISDRYIQLAPIYETGPVLADGDVIDTDRTTVPVELDDLLAQLKKFLDAVEAGTAENPGAIGQLVTNAAASLEGTGDDLDKTLSGFGEVSGAVVAESAHLDSLVVHLNNLLQALATRRTEITRVNTNLARSLGAVAEQQAALDGSLTNLALITQELGRILQVHRPRLQTDLRILANTTRRVLNHQDSLVRTNDWLHVLADGVEEAHNGGAIHTCAGSGPEISCQGPNTPGGIAHVDVRDGHASSLIPCPPELDPLVCSTLGISATATSQSAASQQRAAGPGAPGPSPSPTASPLVPSLPTPLPTPKLPKLPKAGAAGDLAGPVSTREPAGPLGWFSERTAVAADTFYEWLKEITS